MLALAKRSVVTEKVDTLLKVGLGLMGKVSVTTTFQGTIRPTVSVRATSHLLDIHALLSNDSTAAPKRLKVSDVLLHSLNGITYGTSGSLLDMTLRIEMDNPIFRKLRHMIEQPCRSKDWFPLAEQVINTIYALGEHPDQLCNDIIKNLTTQAFSRPSKVHGTPAKLDEKVDVEMASDDDDVEMAQENTLSAAEEMLSTSSGQSQGEGNFGDAFRLSQLLFVVGHVAIKQIVFLELVEREWKRQKQGGWSWPVCTRKLILTLQQPMLRRVVVPSLARTAKN
jgi:condensin complex subunit 1